MQALTGGPRAHLTEAQVLAALTSPSPTASHGIDVLDQHDQPITGAILHHDPAVGQIHYSTRSLDPIDGPTVAPAAVRRDAAVTVVDQVDPDWLVSHRFLLWRTLYTPDGTPVRFNRGIYMATLPPIHDDGARITGALQLHDKTWRLDRRIGTPLLIPAGTNRVSWVVDDLATRWGEAAQIPAADTLLVDDEAFTPDATWLHVYNTMLEGAGYDQLHVTDDGPLAATPAADLAGRGSEQRYGPGSGRIVPDGQVESLLPLIYNVVRFTARNAGDLASVGDGIAERRNETVGPAAISRVGEVSIDVPVDAEAQPELEAVADAQAGRYMAGGGLRYTGAVALNPLHADRDINRLVRPRLGLDALAEAVEWTEPFRDIDGTVDSVRTQITWEVRL